MAEVTKINHVAIVVGDIDAALNFWQNALGLTIGSRGGCALAEIHCRLYPVGDSEVELVKPTSDDSGVAKFLAERGGGMHHLCFEVDDITGMLEQLKEKGVRLINEIPMELPGRKMAFVHPKSTGGVLVELYEVTK